MLLALGAPRELPRELPYGAIRYRTYFLRFRIDNKQREVYQVRGGDTQQLLDLCECECDCADQLLQLLGLRPGASELQVRVDTVWDTVLDRVDTVLIYNF